MTHPDGDPPPPETLNIADHFLGRRIASGDGERIALRLDDGVRTYGEVDALAADVARALRQRGVRREERVLLALPDGANFVGAFFGILRLGAVVVMINPGLGRDEIAAQIAYTRARLLITDVDGAERFRPLAEASPWLESGLLIVGDGDGDAGDDSLASALAEAPPWTGPPSVATHRDDAAVWLYSGGTTGRPKAVVQTHRSFVNTTERYAVGVVGYTRDDITLSVPKLYFGYATGSNLLFPFAVGASAVLFDGPPTPEALFERIERHRATLLINVPTVVRRMVAERQAAGDLSSLRLATSAGEALPPSLHEDWNEAFGVPLLDGLGTAEMWHVFLTNRPDDVRPGTLGRVVDGFEIDVRDAVGRPVEDGEVGRLWVRGGSRAIGYWQHMEKTQDAFRGEWFVSGDLVRRDAEGYVTYCGRGDDAIKVSGRWLVPREVEDCLMSHPAVRECAVIGAPDADGLTKPFAFVLPANDPPAGEGDGDGDGGLEQTLQQYCLEHLAAYKHPRRVLRVGEWPRTHLGKVDRGALRRRLAASPGGGG